MIKYFLINYRLQFHENGPVNSESATAMATVVKQVLEEVSSTTAQDIHTSTTPNVADAAESDDAKKPEDGAGETPEDRYTCCALKCDESFTSPDALRYSFCGSVFPSHFVVKTVKIFCTDPSSNRFRFVKSNYQFRTKLRPEKPEHFTE